MHPTMCFTVAVLGRCKDKLTQRSTHDAAQLHHVTHIGSQDLGIVGSDIAWKALKLLRRSTRSRSFSTHHALGKRVAQRTPWP